MYRGEVCLEAAGGCVVKQFTGNQPNVVLVMFLNGTKSKGSKRPYCGVPVKLFLLFAPGIEDYGERDMVARYRSCLSILRLHGFTTMLGQGIFTLPCFHCVHVAIRGWCASLSDFTYCDFV